MDLSAKFKMTSSCQTVGASSLKMDRPFLINRAEKIQTRYGETILLTLQKFAQTFVKVFLPKPYGDLFTEDDIKSIIERSLIHTLRYRGTISNSFILEIDYRIRVSHTFST
jgi:hypothetical protein